MSHKKSDDLSQKDTPLLNVADGEPISVNKDEDLTGTEEELTRRDFLSKTTRVAAGVSATLLLAKKSSLGLIGAGTAGPGQDPRQAPTTPAESGKKYDVIIIGTGFGAAVAVDTLLRTAKAQGEDKKLSVLLVERGAWWFTSERPLPKGPDGQTSPVLKNQRIQYWPKPDHHRGVKNMLSVVQPNRRKNPLQNREASPLYRYNTFENIDIVTASGVGGGSLIYSNVTIEPHFDSASNSYPIMNDWPRNARLSYDDYHREDQTKEKDNPGAFQWMTDRRGPLNPVVTKAPLTESWLESVGVKGKDIYERLANLDKDDDKRAYLYLGKSRALKDASKKGVPGWKNDPWAPLRLALFELTDDLVKDDHNTLPTFCERQGRCLLGCMPGARHTINKMLIGKILSQYPNVTLESLTDVSHIEFVDQSTYKVWLRDREDPRKAAGYRVGSKVIVSAGTLGSTEILLRSREGYEGKNFVGNLRLSDTLGTRFSSNGDFAGFVVPNLKPGKPPETADPSTAEALLPYPVFPTKGPINTSHVMFHKGDMQVNIEDAAIPPMFAPLVRTGLNVMGVLPSNQGGDKHVRDFLGKMFSLWHGSFSNKDKTETDNPLAPLFPGKPDPRRPKSFATEHEWLQEVFFFNCMGKDDPSKSKFYLSDQKGDKKGRLELDYHIDDVRQPVFREIRSILVALAENMGGKYVDFPLWSRFENLAPKFIRQKAITVHPLGGCPMGDTSSQGVVDTKGRVFNTRSGSESVYENLYVMDASIIPGPLAVNPTLTIVAMSLKIAKGIRV